MSKEKSKMPIFGIGPLYLISCFLITSLALILNKKGYFELGQINKGKMLFTIIAIFFVIFGLYLYIKSVIVQKITKEISNGKLVTNGVYAIVRNPIYTAFLFIFTGIIVYARNVFLFILPVFFWWFLTFLLKHTEEKWLKKMFGKDYEEYIKNVNRVIPWFPKKKL